MSLHRGSRAMTQSSSQFHNKSTHLSHTISDHHDLAHFIQYPAIPTLIPPMATAANDRRLTNSEYRKKKEIDEARKNGTLPPEKDSEGNLINPHNPEYISKRPWYLGDSGPSLKHQNIQNQSHLLSIQEADALYISGKRKRRPADLVRNKNACKNCGYATHQTRECVDRPRKPGSNKPKPCENDTNFLDIRSQKYGKLSFDAKRDQWLGYDPKDHAKTIERYEKVDSVRKKLRKAQDDLEKANAKKTRSTISDSDSDSDSGMESEESEFRDHEGMLFVERIARQGGAGGAQMMTTVRNLRIREDTAKYLRNLNPNSAYYDPKTRSMRENPNPELSTEEAAFVGDNVVRSTGDAQRLASMQMFAWEAHSRGTDIHPIANPSQTEFLKKQFETKKRALEADRRRNILETYGGESHLNPVPRELLLQSETYVEYARDGRVLRGKERAPVRSKYVEDVLEGNHSSVWGSYYDRKAIRWGFGCCHSTVRGSYCTGEDGKLAEQSCVAVSVKKNVVESALEPKHSVGKRSDLYGENLAPELDQEKLKEAMDRAQKKPKQSKYNSNDAGEVSIEDLEAYKLLKARKEDPMGDLIGTNVLLE